MGGGRKTDRKAAENIHKNEESFICTNKLWNNVHLGQGMVSFSLMSNTPPPPRSPSRGNTPWVGQQKRCCVSGPPGLNAAFMRPGWVRSDWVIWSWSCWHPVTHKYTSTHWHTQLMLPFPRLRGLKTALVQKTMGLSIAPSFPATYNLFLHNCHWATIVLSTSFCWVLIARIVQL